VGQKKVKKHWIKTFSDGPRNNMWCEQYCQMVVT